VLSAIPSAPIIYSFSFSLTIKDKRGSRRVGGGEEGGRGGGAGSADKVSLLLMAKLGKLGGSHRLPLSLSKDLKKRVDKIISVREAGLNILRILQIL
jgi:hypothetical protein